MIKEAGIRHRQARYAYDALIVGAGPAGVSCAVWLARLGLRPLLLDAAPQVGGLCRGNPYPDPWTLLLPGADGDAIARHLEGSVADAGVPLLLGRRVTRVTLSEAAGAARFSAYPEGAEVVQGHAVVLATGVRPRGRELCRASDGRPLADIIIGPGAEVRRQNYAGKRVAVLGGGDNAFENALEIASRGAAEVKIYARNVRARQQLQQAVPQEWVHRGPCSVDYTARRVDGRSYDLILVFYGWEPAAELAAGLGLERDPHGFVATERYTAQTSVKGVYAIGELTQRQHPSVLTAMADGVVAAKAIQNALERGTD